MRRALRAVALSAAVVAVSACGAILGIDDRYAKDGDAGDAGLDVAIAGPARAALSASAVDFGLVGCGQPAAPARTVTITNLGAEPLTWSAAIEQTPWFTITGPAAGTIPGGGSASVAVSPSGVPAFASAGDTAQAVLVLTTNDAQTPTARVPLKLTAAGGQLTVVPLAAAFGDVPVGTPATDLPLTVTNTGNAPVSVTVAEPSDPQFVLAWSGAPAAVVIPPGGTIAGLVARFTPNVPGLTSATASLGMSGVTCGASAPALTLTGVGSVGPAAVQPGALDFGLVACGARAAARTFTVRNTGGSSLQWTAALTAGTAYALAPSSGTLAAGATATIVVTPAQIPSSSAVTPDLYADTVTITTDAAGDVPHEVELHQTALGAILAASTSAMDFGGVAVGGVATSQTTVSNRGNAPATVSFGTTDPAFTVTPQGQVVGGGASYIASLTFRPTVVGGYAADARLEVPPTTALCEALPGAIALTGSGTAASVVRVSPTNVDFGMVNCGTQAAARTVRVENVGGASFTFNAALTKGTAYALSGAAGGLAPGASADVTIAPNAIPATSAVTPDLYADTLTITTDAAGDTPHVVALHETARGVILRVNPASLAFGKVSRSATRNVVFDDAGNLGTRLALRITGANRGQFSVPQDHVDLGPGTSARLAVTFSTKGGGNGLKTAQLEFSPDAPLCAPLPSFIPLSGQKD